MTKRISLAAIIIIALVLTITTYAFAAANSMPGVSNAGDGAVTISGYTIGTPRYTLGTDPSEIASVSFTIVPLSGGTAPTITKVQLVSGGDWFLCTGADTGTATCTVTGVTVFAADNFHVVAAD